MFRRGLGGLGEGAPVAAHVGEAGGATNYIELAPWTSPPRGSIPFFMSGFDTFSGAASQILTPAALALAQTNDNEMTVIAGFSMLCNDMTLATDVTWSLLVGGAPVRGLNGVRILPRIATSVQRPLSCLVFVPPLQSVKVIITNSAATPQANLVGADLEGWTYQLKR
jgi:hypothetical protein